MKVIGIHTRAMQPPHDDLWAWLAESVSQLPERSVLAIASKVVAIGEGRCVPAESIELDELIVQEADKFLPRSAVPNGHIIHTIKKNLLIGSAGVDKSNANGYFILWPQDSAKAARDIYQFLKKQFKTKQFGVIITDSHSVPMRRGTSGISLGHYGFKPLKDYRGQADIFGRELQTTMTNLADGLAATATLMMGEGAELKPLVLIEDIELEFVDAAYRPQDPDTQFEIPHNQDMFKPFLDGVDWQEK